MTAPRDRTPPPPEALPLALASLVESVVRRTRLRRREKVEIAAELEAHFRDGLARGRTAEQLVESFGDPRTTARELRHGVIAKRSALDRLLRRTLQIGGLGVAAIVAGYLAVAIHVAGLRPTIAFDPIERYRSQLPRTDSPAWPLYLESLGWVRSDRAIGGDDDPFGTVERRDAFVEALDRFALGEEGFDGVVSTDAYGTAIDPVDVRAILESRSSDLEVLRRAATLIALGRAPITDPSQASQAERVHFGTPPPMKEPEADGGREQFSSMLLSLLLPQLSELRGAARLLEADARLAEEQRDPTRAAANLAAMFGVARHAEEDRTLIGQLVAAAIRVQACRAIVAMLERSSERFDEAPLQRLADAVASVPDDVLRLDISTERLMFEDVVQRMYSDDGTGDGVFIPWAFSEFMPMVNAMSDVDVAAAADDGGLESVALAVGPLAYLAPGRAETMSQYDRWVAALEEDVRRPWWDLRRSIEEIEREIMPETSGRGAFMGGNLVLGLLLPAVGSAIDVLQAQRFDLDAAAIAIALERFRRAEGAWPDDLGQLVPKQLSQLPSDPETDLPYRYELGPDGPRIWSVGPDGLDDAGRAFLANRTADTRSDTQAPSMRTPPSPTRLPTLRTAVLRHRARVGTWPASIDTLAAEDLEGVAADTRAEGEYLLVDGVPTLRRGPIDGESPRLPRTTRGDVPQGDRILVQWGLGTFRPQVMDTPAYDEPTD
jgi:hypothetical protein